MTLQDLFSFVNFRLSLCFVLIVCLYRCVCERERERRERKEREKREEREREKTMSL